MDTIEQKEPHDGHIYDWVMFCRENVIFFVKSLEFYESLIEEGVTLIDQDEHLKSLITEDVKREFGLEKDVNKAKRTREWLERELAKRDESAFSCDLTISHGKVKYIKSVCSLYIKFLCMRRNLLSVKSNISTKTLEAVDTQITKLEELMNNGVFASASTVSLLVDQLENQEGISQQETEEKLIVHAKRPKPVFVNSI